MLEQESTRVTKTAVVAMVAVNALNWTAGLFRFVAHSGVPIGCPSVWRTLYGHSHVDCLAYALHPLIIQPAPATLLSALLATFAIARIEHSLHRFFRSSGMWVGAWACLVGAAAGARIVLGWTFFRGTGWAAPDYFFPLAATECYAGPALYVLLLAVLHASFDPTSVTKLPFVHWSVTNYAVNIAIIMTAMMLLPPAFWATAAAVLVAALWLLLRTLAQRIDISGQRSKPNRVFNLYIYRTLLFLAMTLLLQIFVIPSLYNSRPSSISITPLRMFAATYPYLMTIMIMTAPRRCTVNYLNETVHSYIHHLPTTPSDPLYNRIQIIVATSFPNHPHYNELCANQHSFLMKCVRLYRSRGKVADGQRYDFQKGLEYFETHFARKSLYLTIIEDDFPICPGGWETMWRMILHANVNTRERPNRHCGLFIGTGGRYPTLLCHLLKNV